MKNLLIGLVLTATTTAFAQTTSTSLPEAETASSAAATPSATQTITTKMEAVKSNFGANLIFEGTVGVGDLKENQGEAKMESLNAIGLTYKVSEEIKTEIRHNFYLRSVSDREQLRKDDGTYQDAYEAYDPTIHMNIKTPYTFLGSKPITSSNRYYVPLTQGTQDRKNLGTFRSTVVPAWDLDTRWTFEYLAEVRLTPNTTANSNGAIGSDMLFRYVTGPAINYNFSDSVYAYYIPYFDLITTGHQRGDFSKADQRNDINQELGVSVAIGSVTLNPYWSTTASRNTGSEAYVGAGSDETSSYNLLVQAVF